MGHQDVQNSYSNMPKFYWYLFSNTYSKPLEGAAAMISTIKTRHEEYGQILNRSRLQMDLYYASLHNPASIRVVIAEEICVLLVGSIRVWQLLDSTFRTYPAGSCGHQFIHQR